jgi:hypothetical protein
MKVRLWFIRETPAARLYSRLPPERRTKDDRSDEVWLPRSQIEHTMKFGDEHHLTVTDWIAEQKDL